MIDAGWPRGRQDEAYQTFNTALKEASSGSWLRSKEAARENLASELLKRGLIFPPHVVNWYVDRMLVGGVPGIARRYAHALSSAGTLARTLAAASRQQELPRWRLWDSRIVAPDPGHPGFDVLLRPSADDVLSVGNDDLLIGVWLQEGKIPEDIHAGPASNISSAEEALILFRGDMAVGVLGKDADAAYRPIVQEAAADGVFVVAEAVRSRTDDGKWRLRIGFPSKRQPGLAGLFV